MSYLDLSAYREGQYKGHINILRNFKERYPFTPIVLPMRFGKSDVIIASSIDGWAQGAICASFLLSPSAILRDQIIANDKMEETFKRYSINVEGIKLHSVKGIPNSIYDLSPNGEMLISMTTQLATDSLMTNLLCQFANHMFYKTSLPIAVYIDECHTSRHDRPWGQLAERLKKEGALIVLSTATPYRTDGENIAGLKTTIITKEPVTYPTWKPDQEPGKIWRLVWQASKEVVQLDLDWVNERGVYVPFAEAWRRSYLCHFNRTPFDVKLSNLDIEEDDFDDGVMLSDLSSNKTSQWLGKIVRDSEVITRGCQIFVEKLTTYKKIIREIAGIIFCGMDDPGNDQIADYHAKKIKKILHRLDNSLEILIATSSGDNEGNDVVESFRMGKGDVLIVKYMAGVGLDVPRAKVELDLSPVRTPPSFTQRIARVATPYQGIFACDYITPDDCLGRLLFRHFIEDEGGATRITNQELVNQMLVDRKDKPKENLGIQGTNISDFQDSKGQWSEASQYAPVTQFVQKFPHVKMYYTDNDIAEGLSELNFQVANPVVSFVNTDIIVETIKDDCNDLATRIAGKMLVRIGGDRNRYGEIIADVWNKAKDRTGISLKQELKDIKNITQLKRLKRTLEVMDNELRDDFGYSCH